MTAEELAGQLFDYLEPHEPCYEGAGRLTCNHCEDIKYIKKRLEKYRQQTLREAADLVDKHTYSLTSPMIEDGRKLREAILAMMEKDTG
jgi:hypothetical protein